MLLQHSRVQTQVQAGAARWHFHSLFSTKLGGGRRKQESSGIQQNQHICINTTACLSTRSPMNAHAMRDAKCRYFFLTVFYS